LKKRLSFPLKRLPPADPRQPGGSLALDAATGVQTTSLCRRSCVTFDPHVFLPFGGEVLDRSTDDIPAVLSRPTATGRDDKIEDWRRPTAVDSGRTALALGFPFIDIILSIKFISIY